ncbi:hypothetical protein [Azospirillum rugosum]|uniref:Non-ribosomal peptide synthetase component F n=1 Tax=Azospirillum rugosum TaxID=416170 RepID=A0ABS4SKL6_9PROT|nr:hypothetical protein [Azospirillum rugosum]MBP2293101.1 non-ribosomal peptide synthetase component F [Azospirillum rugosum]MDQ0526650.1 non-ribosomal peptide synthetase component F [Azospirillum rugosum]
MFRDAPPPSASAHSDSPDGPGLAALERSHDGPPPRHALKIALLGGGERHTALALSAARSLHDRLAAEARQGAARRRAALPAAGAAADAWLSRLSRTLAHHRHAACALAAAAFDSAY